MSDSRMPSRAMLDIWYARVGKAKAFLRWAGGKSAFLHQYGYKIPTFNGNYLEPFLGSGAVFFHVVGRGTHPLRAQLGDTNKQLVRTFIAVRDDPVGLAEQLTMLESGFRAASDKPAFYYQVRDAYNASLPKVDPAAFIFLNRACWNGLYRVNRSGKFNVPYGAPKKSALALPREEDLLNASAALAQANIRATSWENTLALAEQGDFAFIDPPYYSDLVRDDTKYQRRSFSVRDHHNLAQALTRLKTRGVMFMLTNSGEAEMIDMYRSSGLEVEEISIPRSINSKVDRRMSVPEIIVTPTKL